MAACIKIGKTTLEKYSGNPQIVNEMMIRESLPNKLQKLKKIYPEAFYYWSKTSELL